MPTTALNIPAKKTYWASPLYESAAADVLSVNPNYSDGDQLLGVHYYWYMRDPSYVNTLYKDPDSIWDSDQIKKNNPGMNMVEDFSFPDTPAAYTNPTIITTFSFNAPKWKGPPPLLPDYAYFSLTVKRVAPTKDPFVFKIVRINSDSSRETDLVYGPKIESLSDFLHVGCSEEENFVSYTSKKYENIEPDTGFQIWFGGRFYIFDLKSEVWMKPDNGSV